MLLLDHSPNNDHSPGLEGLGFEVYRYLVAKFPPVLDLLQHLLTDAQWHFSRVKEANSDGCAVQKWQSRAPPKLAFSVLDQL